MSPNWTRRPTIGPSASCGLSPTLAWAIGIVVLAGVVILFGTGATAKPAAFRELVDAERERRRAEVRYAALMQEAKEIVLLL